MDIETYNDSKSLETVPIMLEQNSLEELLSISATQRSNLRTIIMCTYHVSRNHDEDDGITDTNNYSNGDSDTEYFDAERNDVPTTASMDQGAYWSCLLGQEAFTRGLDVSYLTLALRKLPDCQKICISDAYLPWGSAQLEERIGTQLCKGFDQDSPYSKRFVTRVLRTTLIVISISGIQVTELDISLGLTGGRGSHSMTDDILHLPKNYQPLMDHGFPNIKTLKLVVNTQDDEYWDKNVSSFIELFPNLSHFRLHLADRGSSVEFPYLTEVLERLSLQVFELVNCSTTQENLMPLLLCHQATVEKEAALEKIILRDVNIEQGKNGTWKWVKNHLRTELPRCSLELRHCLVAGKVPTMPITVWHEL
ncbi:hypothetical protein VFPPC_12221 [Pochonia chlamydosporia 170]|uniref:F-box domain-containing protein n=1 Tax=Pochonia chlamydosporia 170 TaxID=1380566 RepID=A0A179EYH8_METCM|nr:hypothetical protein VFPPC_12221 [Pochonia chlamydosporia 170]OAQ58255.1 hypothetical protein VFPPC_12221 [Pochonia chlamydosporia 170]